MEKYVKPNSSTHRLSTGNLLAGSCMTGITPVHSDPGPCVKPYHAPTYKSSFWEAWDWLLSLIFGK